MAGYQEKYSTEVCVSQSHEPTFENNNCEQDNSRSQQLVVLAQTLHTH